VGYLLARDPDTVRGADLSFISRERLTSFDDARFFRGAPDLAVEILSPSNRRGEMQARAADYLAAGARLVWVIDPKRRTVVVHRPGVAPRRLGAGEDLDGEDVLPELVIPFTAIFER
jgi:Uma2 family endonuclease